MEKKGIAEENKNLKIELGLLNNSYSQLKRTAEELKQSEEKFKIIFEGSADGILVADLKTRKFIFTNPAICKITGYSSKELLKLGLNEMHPKKDLPYVLDCFKKQAKKEIEIAKDIPVLRKDGKTVYCDVNSGPIVLEGKGAIVGFFRDITERRKAEEELRESENRYRNLFENSPILKVLVDDKLALIDINKKGEELTGYKKEEVLGKNIMQMPIFSRKTKGLMHEKSARKLKGRYMKPYEIEFTDKKGGKHIGMLYGAGIHNEIEKKDYGLFMMTDETERIKAEEEIREKEEKYRLLIENLPQKIFFKDRNSVYIYCNENYARDLNINEKDIAGKNDFEFYSKELAEKYRADDKRIMDTGKTEDIEEKYLKGGQEIWVHTLKVPLKNENGEVTGIMGLFWDITAEKTAKESQKKYIKQIEEEKKSVETKVRERTLELQEAYEKLKDLDRAKEEFISMLSHELKTPIFPIMGYVDMLLKGDMGKITKVQDEKLKIVAKNAANLNRLVGDMLDMSRLELKRMKFDMEKNEITSLAKEAVDSLAILAKHKNISVRLDAKEKITLICDRKRIQQVIDNLMTNSLKFTKEKGEITLSITSDKDNAIVNIKDNGIGIPKQYHKYLFSRFFQVTKGGARESGGGTGLGLAISKGIIEMHHGKIWLESYVGKGSTFTFTLPLHQKP